MNNKTNPIASGTQINKFLVTKKIHLFLHSYRFFLLTTYSFTKNNVSTKIAYLSIGGYDFGKKDEQKYKHTKSNK